MGRGRYWKLAGGVFGFAEKNKRFNYVQIRGGFRYLQGLEERRGLIGNLADFRKKSKRKEGEKKTGCVYIPAKGAESIPKLRPPDVIHLSVHRGALC